MFELAKLDSGIEQAGTQFPIEDKRKGFEFRIKGKGLGGINARHVAMIEQLQPYQGCQWTAALRDISNPDKHREFVAIRGDWRIEWRHSLNEPDPARLAALLGTMHRAYHPGRGAEVDVKLRFISTILLDGGTPVTDALEEIQAQVAATLTAFKPEF